MYALFCCCRLLMAQVESQERRRAEEEITKLLGASQVRFVDMHCTWHGSTGAAAGGSGPAAAAAAASGKGGLDLMPVYVPAYVFSWWHGGTKVRQFSLFKTIFIILIQSLRQFSFFSAILLI